MSRSEALYRLMRSPWLWISLSGVIAGVALALATLLSLQPLPQDLRSAISVSHKNSYYDRHGKRLNVTYQNHWNIHDWVSLHEVPQFLQDGFIVAEDKRFYRHHGVDWVARLAALYQNLTAGRVVRGASTISEQVVRMLHPRPRTIWSRWLEGFEAGRLEARFSKPEILEFYLNQVPYRARRRGVVKAARYYFDRDLGSLSKQEMLALSVLVRSPQRLDPLRHPGRLKQAIARLVDRVTISPQQKLALTREPLLVHSDQVDHDLSHFIEFADSQQRVNPTGEGRVNTTLDLELQTTAQRILDSTLDRFSQQGVMNGAVLVVDHHSNEILSWVVGRAGREDDIGNRINAVSALRQPGSALKPFVYTLALSRGWQAATVIDDSPLEESVGLGLHRYRNYSNQHYGPVSLREALGNSLNIPAVKALQFVGTEDFLDFLYRLGIASVSSHPNVYGDGIALGNGELSLFELVQAYTVLARMGSFKPLAWIEGEKGFSASQQVMTREVASLIADILSDPAAREKEFGWDSVLNFPRQTAVKTGTSSDYRDAWALGFNDRYTIGVWMGNLDYKPMQEVTGASGPAWVLRALFNETDRGRETRPLYLSPRLVKQRVCVDMDTALSAVEHCLGRDEWFIAESSNQPDAALQPLRIRKPSPGLLLAMDPRIPDDREHFEFALNRQQSVSQVKWFVNDSLSAVTSEPTYLWRLQPGVFSVHAEVLIEDQPQPVVTDQVSYRVY